MDIELKNKIKEILSSKVFKVCIYGLGVFFVSSIIFQAGMFVGFHRASFGRDFGDNYEKNFGGPRGGSPRMMGNIFRDDLPNAHGAIGKIIKIDEGDIIVMDTKDNTEKIVIINNNTQIRKMRDMATINNLKIDDFVVVIGSPNTKGQIEARLIRLLPEPINMNNFNKQ